MELDGGGFVLLVASRKETVACSTCTYPRVVMASSGAGPACCNGRRCSCRTGSFPWAAPEAVSMGGAFERGAPSRRTRSTRLSHLDGSACPTTLRHTHTLEEASGGSD